MHAPRHFRVEDPARLWAAVAEWGFGTVFSTDAAGVPYATLAPFIVREGRLWGHFSAANPQRRSLDPDREVLVQFVGAHAYVSPAWYSTPGQVPTWNYAQVQVRGRPRQADGAESRFVVEETVREFEGRREQPVTVGEMKETTDRLLGGITAFELDVTSIEGSWKLSQNKSDEDRARVAEELSRGGAYEQAVAELMRTP